MFFMSGTGAQYTGLRILNRIVKLLTMKAKARVFAALADPTRRQILQELKEGELAAGEIVGRFSISAPAISRHLSILETAGLVSFRRDGNRILYQLEPETLASTLGDFLSAVCPAQVVHRRTKKRRSS
jgi:DNA-binding transcriptional ArsR family regulator